MGSGIFNYIFTLTITILEKFQINVYVCNKHTMQTLNLLILYLNVQW